MYYTFAQTKESFSFKFRKKVDTKHHQIDQNHPQLSNFDRFGDF
jgi:hypothetical protein